MRDQILRSAEEEAGCRRGDDQEGKARRGRNSNSERKMELKIVTADLCVVKNASRWMDATRVESSEESITPGEGLRQSSSSFRERESLCWNSILSPC